jgi:MFS family permease
MTDSAPSSRFTVWLSLAQLVGWGSVFYAFSMLLSPVEAALGATRAEVSLALSLALLAEGLAAYPVGRWIDAGHERQVMAGGSLLAGLGLVGLSLATTLMAVYAAWVCLGLAMAATLYTPVFAVVTRRFPQAYRRHIITLTFLGGLASTVFIPLMAWLLSTVGWRHMLWVLAGCQWLVCLPIHAVLLRGAPRPGGPQRWGSSVQTGTTTTGHTRLQAMRQPTFALVGLFQVLMMGIMVAVAAHLVRLLQESGLSAAMAVALPASIGLVQVAGRALLFFFEHRFSVHTLNRWIPVLIPSGLLALVLSLTWFKGGLVVAGLFVALYGLGNGMVTIVKGTAVAQYVNQPHAASLNGALGLPIAMGRAIAPWALGALWSPSAGYLPGLWVLLAASLVAVGALVWAQHISQPKSASSA